MNDINVEIGQITVLMNQQILMAAMAGGNLRLLQAHGHLQESGSEPGINDVEARLLIAMVDKLESLIRDGMTFVQALEWLRKAGWTERLNHHTRYRIGA